MSGSPEGDASPQMRRVLYEIGALWQRVRKKVDRSGDTMSGGLTSTAHIRLDDSDGDSGEKIEFNAFAAGPRIRARDGSDNVLDDITWRTSNNRWEIGEGLLVSGDFDVSGTKNAQIFDPDDATRGWHFAAVEADRSGVLEHEAEVDVGTTYALPPHWPRIAKNLRAYIQPLGEGHVWPEIDRENWTITPRGQPSRCLLLARADRADVAVGKWTHEVEVSGDEGAAP